LCIVRVSDDSASMIPQDFRQFCGIAKIVPAAVGFDIDGTIAQRPKKILHFSVIRIPFTGFGGVHEGPEDPLVVIHNNPVSPGRYKGVSTMLNL